MSVQRRRAAARKLRLDVILFGMRQAYHHNLRELAQIPNGKSERARALAREWAQQGLRLYVEHWSRLPRLWDDNGIRQLYDHPYELRRGNHVVAAVTQPYRPWPDDVVLDDAEVRPILDAFARQHGLVWRRDQGMNIWRPGTVAYVFEPAA